MRKDIEQLANSSNLEDKIQAAKHSALFIVASDIAEKLVEDESWAVRQALIQNRNLFIQPNIVEKFLNKSILVRTLLAKRPDLFTALSIAEKLANDEDWFIRAKIAEHPELLDKAPQIAEKLTQDEDEFVRFLITKRTK
jgi:3-methyladenine DNA glycosylase AlkC